MKDENNIIQIALSTLGGALFLAVLIGAVYVFGALVEGLK